MILSLQCLESVAVTSSESQKSKKRSAKKSEKKSRKRSKIRSEEITSMNSQRVDEELRYSTCSSLFTLYRSTVKLKKSESPKKKESNLKSHNSGIILLFLMLICIQGISSEKGVVVSPNKQMAIKKSSPGI